MAMPGPTYPAPDPSLQLFLAIAGSWLTRLLSPNLTLPGLASSPAESPDGWNRCLAATACPAPLRYRGAGTASGGHGGGTRASAGAGQRAPELGHVWLAGVGQSHQACVCVTAGSVLSGCHRSGPPPPQLTYGEAVGHLSQTYTCSLFTSLCIPALLCMSIHKDTRTRSKQLHQAQHLL